MARETPLIVSFNGGELSGKIDARSDISKYFSGCRTLENYIPMVEGGARRMPGTYFVVATKDSTKAARLMSFHFSTIQAYILEFGDQYLRFFKDEGQIVIDTTMLDFDPSSGYFVGEYCKVGASVTRVIAATKTLYISAPYGRVDSDTVKVAVDTAGLDTMSVAEAGDTITISLADTTGAKNAANLIQVALRALATCNGVDISDWCVTENAAYAAARPIAAALGAVLLAGGETLYQCDVEIFASATNTNFYPPAEATEWTLVAAGDPTEIVMPYLEADLPVLKFTQSADVLYIFHPSHPPKKLARTSHIQWELSDYVCKTGVEMAITGISQASPAVVTCTTVEVTLVAGDIVYIETVVGMTELNHRYFTVGTVVTGAAGTFELSGIDSTGYTAYGSAGTAQEAIYGITDENPACGTFFEQRMVTGGSNNNSQTFNCSHSADYENHTPDATDDSAGIQYTIVSDRVDRILWMIGFEFLVIGTVGGVWKVGATSANDPITQTNIVAKRQVTLGCKDLDPEIVSDALLWVTRSGFSVQQFSYSLEKDKWVPLDMTRISKHITLGATLALSGIKDMDFQKEPLPILWAIRSDGQLLGLTYESQEQVFAWFRVVTDGLFESIAVISQDDAEDQIWVTVNRTGGRYVEFFTPIEFFSQIKDCFFVHSGLTWDGGASASVTTISLASPCVAVLAGGHVVVTGDQIKFSGTGTWLDTHIVTAHLVAVNTVTIWDETDAIPIDSSAFDAYVSGGTVEVVKGAFVVGLDHLEGETVDILVDGAVHSQEVVTLGAITLDYFGNKIHVGLPCTATLEPMKIHAGSKLGTARGKKQKIYKLTAMFYESRGGKVGPDTDNLKPIKFGTGVQPDLFTGDKDIEFGGNWGNEATISIVQDQPLPMTVLGLVPHLMLNE